MFLRVFSLSMGLGVLVALVGVLAISGADLLSAMFITAISPGPAILVSSLAAAQLARIATRADPRWPRRDWLRRGAAFGAIAGGQLLALWVVMFNLPAGGPPAVFVVLMLTAGAVAGGVIGLVLGWYGWSLAGAHAGCRRPRAPRRLV